MKKYFYPFAFVAVFSSILLIASCSKKKDTTSTSTTTSTTASTGTTTTTVKKCLPKDVTYTDGTGTVEYILARDSTTDSITGYSGGGIQYTIKKVSATNIEISTGTFNIEKILAGGGIYQTYTMTGSVKSPYVFQYQLVGGSFPSYNTIQYMITYFNGKQVALTTWSYVNGLPTTETIAHNPPDFNKPDTTITYTFDNNSTTLPGGLLTKDRIHYSAIDFAKHNVLSATLTDSLSNNFTSTYSYDDFTSDNIPGKVTVTGYNARTIFYDFNCK